MRTLLQNLTACPLQLLPIPDRHSSPTLQVIVTLHESFDLLTAMDSETMRAGDVVYIDSVILILYVYPLFRVLYSVSYTYLLFLLSAHAQYVLSHIVCRCRLTNKNLLRAKTVQNQTHVFIL